MASHPAVTNLTCWPVRPTSIWPTCFWTYNPFAVEARYQIGDFKLPSDRARILEEIQRLVDKLRSEISTQAKD